MNTPHNFPPSSSRPRLSVLGVGYLGTTHAVCMAQLGYDVIGVDVDRDRIEKLSSGSVPFFEPCVEEMLRENIHEGRLRFSTEYAKAAEFADVHFVCVGTPQQSESHAADTSALRAAILALAPHVRRESLVVGKSTVPVGTAAQMEKLLHKHAPARDAVQLAWNPEFLREGDAVQATLRPERLVFGVRSAWAREKLDAAYAGVYQLAATDQRPLEIIECDYATAELSKVAANAFLATKISFINAVADLCETSGADVRKLARTLGADPRIGPRFLEAGIGYGGGCLPKDVRALYARAEELGSGSSLRFLECVDALNTRRRADAVARIAELVGGTLQDAHVGVWGVTFKPSTDDVRDSPAADIAAQLCEAGARVSMYDPAGMESARQLLPNATYALTAEEAAADADVLAVLTEWGEFAACDPHRIGEVVRHKRVFDGRNCLDAQAWHASGWEYCGVGVPKMNAVETVEQA